METFGRLREYGGGGARGRPTAARGQWPAARTHGGRWVTVAAELLVDVFPPEFPRAAEISELVHAVARSLPLHGSLPWVTVAFDAPEFEGSGFWHFEHDAAGRLHASLYGAPLDVLTPSTEMRCRGAALATDQLGEIPAHDVDRILLDRWIHRNLLQLDDLLRHRVLPARVPRDRVIGFAACWDVWTDGRLKARRKPGLSLAERRRHFFRTFATGGLLLPRHWNTFHQLWEGQYPEHAGLQAALERLPRERPLPRAGAPGMAPGHDDDTGAVG
jgi:hypothetical protein